MYIHVIKFIIMIASHPVAVKNALCFDHYFLSLSG